MGNITSVKQRIFTIVTIALCALLITLSIFGLRRMTARSRNLSATAEGLAYLRDLAGRDLSDIDEILAEQKSAREAAERDERIKELTDGTVDVWSYFTDYVLFGDSRAVGFSYYGFLSDDRVLAEGGWTIRDLEAHLNDIVAMNPTSIYLCFGLNDVSIGFWQTPEEYAAEFKEVLGKIGELLPNATVYVNSILPAIDPAFDLSEDWRNIPQYSAAVEKMCKENGYVFINNDKIAEEHVDMYDEDGIHLFSTFYPYWAANMMLTIYGNIELPEGEQGDGEAAETTTEESWEETEDTASDEETYTEETVNYEDTGYDETGYEDYGYDNTGNAEYTYEDYGYTDYGYDDTGYTDYGYDDTGYTDYGYDDTGYYYEETVYG